MTGSAGWNYTAATKWILGIRPTYSGLLIDPCVPKDWKEFEITRKWRGATFRIRVKNPRGVEKGIKLITLNGTPVVGVIPLQACGSKNDVDVVMG